MTTCVWISCASVWMVLVSSVFRWSSASCSKKSWSALRCVNSAWRFWPIITNVEISLAHVRMTGRGTAGVVEAGVLLTERDDLLVERFRAEASVAIGPAGEYEDLRVGLAAVHPDLPNRIDGAWERIRGGGADAAGQAANSLMEAVDWTLRLLAPDDDVLAWHASENRPDSELHMGKPTRPLRLRYAVRDRPEKLPALTLYVRTIQELVSVIQAPKHSVETRAVEALTPIAMTVEGLLYYLVIG